MKIGGRVCLSVMLGSGGPSSSWRNAILRLSGEKYKMETDGYKNETICIFWCT